MALLNDEMYIETSRKFAERMMKEGGSVARAAPGLGAARWPLRARPPMPRCAFWNKGLTARLAQYRADRASAEKLLSAGKSPRDQSLDTAELAAYTTAASVILNLDEVITRQ